MTTFIVTIRNGGMDFGSDFNASRFRQFCKEHEGKALHIESVTKEKLRTSQQNRALHLWFTLIAEALNDAGYTVQMVLRQKLDLDWDKDMVKELLWRPAQQKILRKKSTTELKKREDIDKVWEHLNRHLGEKFKVHVPFPTDDTIETITGARIKEQ